VRRHDKDELGHRVDKLRHGVVRHSVLQAGVDGCPSNSDERLDTAAAAFKTPADLNMHKVLREAIRQGGISRDDFPAPIRRHVFIMSGAPPAEPEAACHAARSTASRQ